MIIKPEKYKLWLKISSIILAFGMLWVVLTSVSLAIASGIKIIGMIVGLILGLGLSVVVLYPVFYYAWKK